MQQLLLFQVTIREDGTRGLAKGWAPTFYGYSMQVCEYVAYLYKSVIFSESTIIYTFLLNI